MEKAKSCKTPEDMLALAKEEGYQLSDEELEGIAGGVWDCFPDCSTFRAYCRTEDDFL